MGKSSSAKKVARAARAGGAKTSSDKRQLGFPAVVASVILLGTAGVVAAKTTQTATAQGIALGEHWHSAYSIYACGEFLPGQEDADPRAQHHIHAHLAGDGPETDGLIHIHPQSSGFTRSNGNIGAFTDTVGADLTDDALTLSDGTSFSEADGCEDEDGDAQLRIARWEDGPSVAEGDEPDEIITSDLRNVRFDKDAEAFTIFFGAPDADIPVPETISNIGNASDVVDPNQPEILTEDLEDGVTEEEAGTDESNVDGADDVEADGASDEADGATDDVEADGASDEADGATDDVEADGATDEADGATDDVQADGAADEADGASDEADGDADEAGDTDTADAETDGAADESADADSVADGTEGE